MDDLEAVRRGDPEAREEWVAAWWPRVYRMALALTGHEADAEDLAQDTMVAALEALPRYRGNAQPSTWLYAILVRRHRSYLRRGPPPPRTPIDPPDPALENALSILSHLSPAQRVTAALFYIEDMNVKEFPALSVCPRLLCAGVSIEQGTTCDVPLTEWLIHHLEINAMNEEEREIRAALRGLRQAPIPPAPPMAPPVSKKARAPVGIFAAAAAMLFLLILVLGDFIKDDTDVASALSERLSTLQVRVGNIENEELRSLLQQEITLLRRELELAKRDSGTPNPH